MDESALLRREFRPNLLWVRSWNVVAIIGAIMTAQVAYAAEIAPAGDTAVRETFESTIRPFFTRNCQQCHGPQKQKGGLRLDTLDPNFTKSDTAKKWADVVDVLRSGDMPPEGSPRPDKVQQERAVDYLSRQLKAASRLEDGRVALRRLNALEYENTLRDLLPIGELELKEMLPPDGLSHGFDNVGEGLQISSVQMESYLQAAEYALDAAFKPLPPAKTLKRYFLPQDPSIIPSGHLREGYRLDGTALVAFNSAEPDVTLGQFKSSQAGYYRYRVAAYPFRNDGKPEKPITFCVGTNLNRGKSVTQRIPSFGTLLENPLQYFDAAGTAANPTVVEFTAWTKANHTLTVEPYGLGTPFKKGTSWVYKPTDKERYTATNFNGPGLAVAWMEVEGPLENTSHPDSGYQRLIGGVDLTKGTLSDAERILADFLPRAFRRPVASEEISACLSLVRRRLEDQYSFQEALRDGLKMALCSPAFIFRWEKPGKLDEFALASRLSYFLWSTMPDAELFELAKRGVLGRAEVLRLQVERMLAHPKARAFTTHFCGQWLDLRAIRAISPDLKLYPEFDEYLRNSMVMETEAFFEEMLLNDLSPLNFIDSDFVMLNQRLARHYGIQGVEGAQFRKVKLPAGCHRGGLLTQASVLMATANGTTTSPILRGNWVLKNLLGQEVPPPPVGVTAVEPDTRGATTIREQLAIHRNDASCASCHQKIDPPGFALENFDPIGGWRERYRSLELGDKVDLKILTQVLPEHGVHRNHVEGWYRVVNVLYRQGPAVDASYALADGRRFQNIDEFKKLLLQDKEQFLRCLTEKILVYATGEGITFSDRTEVDGLVTRLREHNGGLRSLIHEIVQSRLFLEK